MKNMKKNLLKVIVAPYWNVNDVKGSLEDMQILVIVAPYWNVNI